MSAAQRATKAARHDVARYLRKKRGDLQSPYLAMVATVNYADRMCSTFDDDGDTEMSDAYAAITASMAASRDRLAARYPLAVFAPLDDGTEAEALAEVAPPAFPDVMAHGRAGAA